MFTIEDLAEQSGLSIRTIRFYVSEGLLPPPQTRGRNSAYTREALDRLILIQRLKDAHLPLKEIRDQLNALTPEQIHRLAREQDENLTLLFAEVSPQPPPVEADSALNYISRVLDARSAYRTDRPPRAAPVFSQSKDLGGPQKLEPAESWRRVEILPGVELHLREPVDPLIQQKLAKIIEMVKLIIR